MMRNTKEFLAMIAIELVCSDVQDSPDVYGFETWHELWNAARKNDVGVVYLKDEGYEILWLLDEYKNMGTIGYHLDRAYNDAVKVIQRADEWNIDYA